MSTEQEKIFCTIEGKNQERQKKRSQRRKATQFVQNVQIEMAKPYKSKTKNAYQVRI